jgi:SdpI/YfhL protein family
MVPELLFPLLGLLLVALGWPMAARRVRPNRWYGLRVPATFADEKVWYEANAVAGRDMMILGWAIVVVALVLPRVSGVPASAYAGVCAGMLGWVPWSWPCAAGSSRTGCCASGVRSPAASADREPAGRSDPVTAGLRRLLESGSRLLVVVAGAAVLGCGDSQGPPQVEPCPDNLVAISVQNPSAANPTFTWAPSCPVTIVQVSALAPASGIVWSIGGSLENIINSGVRYGRVPEGATGGQATPLQDGVWRTGRRPSRDSADAPKSRRSR